MLNLRFAILVAVAFVLGAMYQGSGENVVQLKIEGQAWCYVGSYKHVDDAPPLPSSLIDVFPGGVRVYSKC